MTDGEHLGASSRSLLDAARPGLGPDPEAQRRMRAKIAASVGGAVGGGAIVAAKTGLAAKLAVVTIAVVIAGGVFFAVRSNDDGATTKAPSVTPQVHEPIEMPGSAHHVEREPQREEQMPAIDARHPVVKPATPVVTPPVAAKKISLAREVELVDRANSALRAKDYRGAIAAVHDHATETSNGGQLAEDAAAIEVEAHCGLREADGKSRLATFDRNYPSSAQHARLEEACK